LGGSRTAPTEVIVGIVPALMRWAVPADNGAMMERGERYGRRSICLMGYDYTMDGAYFVTICTLGREHVFGTVAKGEMLLNDCGREVARCWTWLAEQYPYVYLDEWIVMPDHTHAIIVIADSPTKAYPQTTRLPTPHVGAVREPPIYAPPPLRTPSTEKPTVRSSHRRNVNRWDV
jgi:hypothetical protein